MKKNLVKRFFVEEDGMEVMQVVIIAAIACVIISSAFLIYKNVIHPNVKDAVDKTTKVKPTTAQELQ